MTLIYTACQPKRCFPARPGAVKKSQRGHSIVNTHTTNKYNLRKCGQNLLTVFESNSWCCWAKTLSTLAASVNVTNPNPLEKKNRDKTTTVLKFKRKHTQKQKYSRHSGARRCKCLNVITCHHQLHNSGRDIAMTLLLFLQYFSVDALLIRIVDVLWQITDRRRGLIFIWCLTTWDDDVPPTLWCSHKVNVELHSAAALQQRAFKLIWLAVKPHAGARARTRGHRGTHTHTLD